jgi:CRP/FNR family transcriptional regulator
MGIVHAVVDPQDRVAPSATISHAAIEAAPVRLLATIRDEAVERSTPRSSSWTPTDLFLSTGTDPVATRIIEKILASRTRFQRGDALYRIGDRFDALYAIHYGSCKCVLLGRSGVEQVAAYHMSGEIIGIDGIDAGSHQYQATALEDVEVSRLPFVSIEDLARRSEQFSRDLHKLLVRDGAHAHAMMLLLGTMRAEQRLASFLLELSDRYQARGYSSCEFVLRLTRQEIGSYLGLKLETVSRLFSRFHREGLLRVNGRTVMLLDRIAVRQLADCAV